MPRSDAEERAIILDHIRELTASGLPPEEIAILVRTNKEADTWIDFLESNDVRTEGRAKVDILASPHVQLFLGIFRIIDDPCRHDSDLIDLMRSGLLPIARIDTIRLTYALYQLNYTRKQKMSLFEFLTHPDLMENVTLLGREAIESMCAAILAFQSAMAISSLPSLFRTVVDTWGYDRYVRSQGSFADMEDLFTLFNSIRSWTEDDHTFTLRDLLKRLDLHTRYHISLERTRLSVSSRGIQIRTAHQAKGLEYNTVIISGLSHGAW